MSDTKHIRYVTLTGIANIESYIDNVIADAKTLKDKIQIVSVAVLIHTAKHGDKPTGCRLANKLIDNLGAGIQSKALVDWFTAFGFVLAVEGKGFADVDLDFLRAVFNASTSNPKAIKDGAMGTHWCSFVKETPWQGMDLDKGITSLINKAKAAIERGEKENKVDLVSVDAHKLLLLQHLKNMTDSQCQEILAGFGAEESGNDESQVVVDLTPVALTA